MMPGDPGDLPPIGCFFQLWFGLLAAVLAFVLLVTVVGRLFGVIG